MHVIFLLSIVENWRNGHEMCFEFINFCLELSYSIDSEKYIVNEFLKGLAQSINCFVRVII